MDYLDLTSDDPDEFEGKLVMIDETAYRIGAYLGSGARKMVYELVNQKSGLALFVVLFYKVFDEAAQYAEHAVEVERIANRMLAGKILTENSFVVNAHGATFLVQENLGSIENKESETFRLVQLAGDLLNENRLDQAIEKYQEILRINPYHTHAMNNLAGALIRSGDIEKGLQMIEDVVKLEPHYFPYQQGYIQTLAYCGNIRESIMQYEAVIARYPNLYKTDPLAVQLYLKAGEPERAKVILEQKLTHPDQGERKSYRKKYVLKPKERRELEKEINAAMAMKESARVMMDSAGDLFFFGSPDGVRELLENAHAVYDKDIYITMNLAFALSREGQYDQSSRLLASLLKIVPYDMMRVCYINMLFNEIRTERKETILTLIEVVFFITSVENDDQATIKPQIVLGIAEWVNGLENGELVLIEDINSASELINNTISEISQPVPDFATQLAEWYRAATVAFNQ